MIKLDIDTLLQLFHEKKLEPHFDPATSQVQIVLTVSKREIPVFFNIISGGLVLQSIAYLPIEIGEKHIPDISRLLHILNKQLDLPGFGMDEKARLLFFRVNYPCIGKTFHPNIIDVMLGASELACDSFLSGIELIANGSVSLDKTLKEKNSL